jgi:TDG/mug DNA glycosylase family protein
MKCIGFDPVSDGNTRALILGTMPSAESLRCGEYYANPRNSFWTIMGTLIGAHPKIPYDERLQGTEFRDRRNYPDHQDRRS